MESPNIDTTTAPSAATLSSTTPPDSAIFRDIDNLSPITAVKAPHVITSFPYLTSSVEFTSPNLNLSGGLYSKRFQFFPQSSEEICQHDTEGKRIENGSEYFVNDKARSSSSLIHCAQRESNNGSTENHSPDLNTKSGGKDDVRQDTEKTIITISDIIQLGEQNFEENTLSNKKLVDKDANNESNELLSSSKLQDERPEQDRSDGMSEFLSQPLSPIFGYQDGINDSGEAACVNYENEVLRVSKDQRSRGLQRRLQFEEDGCCIIENTPDSWNPSNAETNTSLSAGLVGLDVPEPPVLERTATSGYIQTANAIQPISTISFRRSRNSSSTISKPSGIGLHLNSIVSSKPKRVTTGIRITSDDKGYPDIKGKNLGSFSGYSRESINNNPYSVKIGRMISTSQIEEGSDSHCPEVRTSKVPVLVKQHDYQATPCAKRKFTLEQDGVTEELTQSSPTKKSKKAFSISDGDGCKRCNCKKTKCLKLYCDCFAAGIYCSGSCSCQGCCNRPDYVDTVLHAREQIESKDPLAFAPKIVKRLIDSHVDSNRNTGTDSTPSSARHKRGCNCKKSMCMKKYCECYQNKVGCSSGCRCEGCQNVYGKKEDHHIEKVACPLLISELCEENSEANQDLFFLNKPNNHHSMTPATPSLQLSNHGKDGSKTEFAARRYLPSPESDVGMISNSQKSLGKGSNSSHLEFDCGDDDKIDGFSPTYDRLSNENSFSRLPHSQDQLSIESGDVSSASSLDRYKSSFTTPIGQFVSAKLCKAGFVEKLENILEDDMPEILKNPIDAVKISSPNKKRVSPPRICGLRQLGSSFSSVGLKSGRKFILRALPSFSPVTPCVDKGSSSETKRS